MGWGFHVYSRVAVAVFLSPRLLLLIIMQCFLSNSPTLYITAFVSTSSSRAVTNARTSASPATFQHSAGCACPSCVGGVLHTPGCTCTACTASHGAFCTCPACLGGGSNTRLFSSAETTEEAAEVPPEVEAQDGILSEEEAHNTDRPARSSLKKKRAPKGKPLSEFEVGSTVTAKVKTITSYGAFMDIGATTDGLLHISNLSAGFVSDVSEFLKEGQETEVRITNLDEGKNQIGLTLLTEAEEEEAAKQQSNRPPRKQQRNNQGNERRDDSAVAAALANKGWDEAQFVEGSVVSTVDFGAFVRFDASQLNSEVEGEMDGLVHISALTAGRAASVTSVVNVGDKVQIRCKAIEGRKVSLTMMSVEDEEAQAEARRAAGVFQPGMSEGAKDWKESLDKIKTNLPSFNNAPLVVDLRK